MNDDIETVWACINGAANLGVEPYYDGPAAYARILARLKTAEDTLNIALEEGSRLIAALEKP